jgi:hypothetical protein
MNKLRSLGALTAAAALALSATSALAQEASPEVPDASPAIESPAPEMASPTNGTESPEPGTEATAEPGTEPGTQAPDAEGPHPAHIHFGSCQQLGDIAFPLSDVSSEMLVDGQPGAGDRVGALTVDPMRDEVRVSVTTVGASLADIVGGEHAINVHLSNDEMGTNIACGSLAGPLILDSGLAIRLHEQDGSGHQGIAWLAQADEATTAVYLFLVRTAGLTGDAGMSGDPATSDDADGAMPEDGEEPAMGEEGTEASTDGQGPAPIEDDPQARATGSQTVRVTVEVTVPEGAEVQVDAEEAPAA